MDERALLERVGELLGRETVRDDCAILPCGEEVLVVSTDMLHTRTDFPEGMTDRQIGWMSAAVTLSDIAGMGAKPEAVLCAVGLDRWERLLGILEGADACCREYGCRIVGGDTDAHDELTVVTTGIGRAPAGRVVRRTGAAPGDLVCLLGVPGCAEAGLAGYPRHRSALLEPRPLIREGQALARAGVSAMMDVSDGLVLSLWDLAAVNPCGFSILSSAVPLPAGVPEREALPMALYGGGDFGLLFSCPRDRFPVPGVAAVAIGTVTAEPGVFVDGKPAPPRGYRHEW
ncbi:MAG: thiamine-phosphate kinase [Methanomicrobiales archaeon]|nr:thiamine-phosphate kinase [Methanomicrobiales archaeon]